MRALKSLIALTLLFALPAAAAPSSERLNYRIHHQTWGDIGTLSEEIRSEGSSTRVATKIDVHVALFGFTLHDAHGEWNEVWRDGYLQQFDATTIADGTSEITQGRKAGGAFVIHAGKKRTEAPPDVQPVNPWSLQFVRATTLMSPETGRLIPAVVRDEGLASVALQGTVAQLHHYVVSAAGVHHLYFDDKGRLVQFEFADTTGKATITLDRPRGMTIADAR